MKQIIIFGLITMIATPLYANMILREDSFGPLKLSRDLKVSKKGLEALFPKYTISQKVASGDSADFHYFEIFDDKKNKIFTVSSYIDQKGESRELGKEVKVDLIKIFSPTIKDQFSVSVGDSYADIMKKRKVYSFGASHHYVFLGKDKIFYNLQGLNDNPNGPDRAGNSYKESEIKKWNWKVHSISWPTFVW